MKLSGVLELQAVPKGTKLPSILATTLLGAFGIMQFWTNSHSYVLLPDFWFVHPSLSLSLALLLFAAFGDTRVSHILPRLSLPAALVGTASVLGIDAFGVFNPPAWSVVVTFLAIGVSEAVFSLGGLLLLASLTARGAFSSICLSSISSIVAVMLMSSSPDIVGSAIGVLAPICSGLAMLKAFHDQPKPRAYEPLFQEGISAITGPLICLIAMRLAYSAANILLKAKYGSFVFGPEPSHLISIGSNLLVIGWLAFLLWWVTARKMSIDFMFLIKVPFALMCLVLAFLGIVGPNPLLQVATVSVAYFSSTCATLLAVDIAQHDKKNPIRNGCLVIAASELAYYVGRCPVYGLTFLASVTPELPFNSTAMFLLVVMALATVLAINPQSKGLRMVFHDINNNSVSESHSAAEVEQLCLALATAKGLSPREEEVMVLIAKGYSKPYIAEALMISDNTVRSHSRHIYEKLGIHSRRELQEAIGLL